MRPWINRAAYLDSGVDHYVQRDCHFLTAEVPIVQVESFLKPESSTLVTDNIKPVNGRKSVLIRWRSTDTHV